MKPALVILAAGMGSRYGGLKQMDAFGPNGETIIDYSIYDAIQAGFGKVVFIIREHFKKDFEDLFRPKLEGKIEVEFVCQELSYLPDGYSPSAERTKPWGTAHAVLVAREAVTEPFAIINADDYYGQSAYKTLADFLMQPINEENNDYCIVGYHLKNTLSEYGTVNRGVCFTDNDGNLTNIVETLKIARNKEGIIEYPKEEGAGTLEPDTLVSMNMFGFMPSFFDYAWAKFQGFLDEVGGELKSEFYIPQVLDQMNEDAFANVKILESDSDWFGVTYQDDKPHVIKKLNKLLEEGKYPNNLWS